MTKTPTMSIRGVSIFSTGLGLAVLLAAIPATAAHVGTTSSCSVVNPNRFQCNFSALTNKTLEIQYVSMQCGSTGTEFSLQEFQVLTTPPNSSSEVSYQIPISNQASLGGVVSTGSPVTLYAKGPYPCSHWDHAVYGLVVRDQP